VLVRQIYVIVPFLFFSAACGGLEPPPLGLEARGRPRGRSICFPEHVFRLDIKLASRNLEPDKVVPWMRKPSKLIPVTAKRRWRHADCPASLSNALERFNKFVWINFLHVRMMFDVGTKRKPYFRGL
jgi:hypothetical protein